MPPSHLGGFLRLSLNFHLGSHRSPASTGHFSIFHVSSGPNIQQTGCKAQPGSLSGMYYVKTIYSHYVKTAIIECVFPM